MGVVLHFLPEYELQFNKELFELNPFKFNLFINLFLLENPFIFKGSNPFP